MASHNSTIITSKFTEKDWIVHIERTVETLDLGTFAQSPPSIFHVPESVRIRDRQSFSPRILALGPYHHWSPDLYQLQNFKLAAAKRAHTKLRVSAEFKEFAPQLAHLASDLRSCYDRHLSMSDAALAWIMAVDGLFLLDLLYFEEDLVPSPPSSISRNAVVRDVLLLENQIPMLLLTKVLADFSGESSITATGQSLTSVSVDLCRRVSPLELPDPDPAFRSENENPPRHLLDLFYRLLLWAKEKPKTKTVDFVDEIPAKKTVNLNNFIRRASENLRRRILAWLRKVSEDGAGSLIATATELRNAGVIFRIAEYGSVSGIDFDLQTKTLSLPSFTWRRNCDVALRNLVAYEAAAEPERPILARYVDLMSGMLQSTEDLKVLEEEGIIIGGEGAGEVFSRGMGFQNGSYSTMLDGTIEAVNEFYKENRRIEVGKTVRRYVRRLMEVGTFVAALCLLVFFCLQVVLGIFESGSSGVTVTSSPAPAAEIAKILPAYSGGSFLAE
ncbi:Putative UPF0481 protein At3g02645 [Linum perenne]